MLMLALAVLVGLVVVGLIVDYRLTQLAQYAEKIVLLLARDVEERSEERISRL